MKNFLKAFSKTASGSVISMLLAAILVKLIAFTSGTQGIAIFSLLKDLSKMLVLGFSISGNVAIVQGLSSNTIVDKKYYINNVIKIVLMNTILISIIFMSSIAFIKEYYFNNIEDINTVSLSLIVVSGIFGSLNVIYNAVLNANRKLGQMALSQVSAAFMGVFASVPILYSFPSSYSYASLLLVMNISWFLINKYFISKNKIEIFWYKSFMTPLKKINFKQFASLSSGTFITGIAGIVTILYLKLLIEQKLGLTKLGIFDAAWTLGTIYIVFLLSSFGTYILPKLSGIDDIYTRNEFLNSMIIIIFSLFVPIIVTMLTFKGYFIIIFYSNQFDDSAVLLQFLLMGDIFKVISWIYGMLFLAHNRVLPFVLLSLFWDFAFLIFVYYGIDKFGLLGVSYSYIVTQLIYMLLVLAVSKNYFLIKISLKSIFILIVSFIVVFATFLFNKNSANIYFYIIIMMIWGCIVYFNLRGEKNDSNIRKI